MNLGGTEKSLLSLLYALQDKSVHVTLLLIERGGVLAEQIPDYVEVKYFNNYQGIKNILADPPQKTLLDFIRSGNILNAVRYFIPFLRIKFTGNWYHNYKFAIDNFEIIDEYDVAVAYASPSDFISYVVAKKITAKQKIQWIHFDFEKVVHNYAFAKKFYPYFSKIYCVSESGRNNFIKILPQFIKKTQVFYNISNPAKIIDASKAAESFPTDFDGMRVLTVGRFTKEKGYHLLPEVVQKLKAEEISFKWYLVGDGKEKERVMKIARECDICDELIFLGAKENPYAFMRDCDVYVQPSVHEGFGITVEEAKVFNKPIVITNFASAKDLIKHNETGFITEVSSEGIFRALKSLLLDDILRSIFTENLSSENSMNSTDVSQLWEN